MPDEISGLKSLLEEHMAQFPQSLKQISFESKISLTSLFYLLKHNRAGKLTQRKLIAYIERSRKNNSEWSGEETGIYSRSRMQTYSGKFIVIRPHFVDKDDIITERVEISWDSSLPGYVARGYPYDEGRKSMERREVHIPSYQSNHFSIYFTNKGWCGLTILRHSGAARILYGSAMSFVFSINGWVPYVSPVCYVKTDTFKGYNNTIISRNDQNYSRYREYISQAMTDDVFIDFFKIK